MMNDERAYVHSPFTKFRPLYHMFAHIEDYSKFHVHMAWFSKVNGAYFTILMVFGLVLSC